MSEWTTYEIFDTRDGLFQENMRISASSPKMALRIAGYTNIERTTDKNAPIVVYGTRGSYLYKGEKPLNRRTK